MTKKDYIKIANVLKTYLDNTCKCKNEWKAASIIDGFSDMLKVDNPNFNRNAFINYINK